MVADITCVPTAAGFSNLAVVVDVWSRRVVGWAMANHLRAEIMQSMFPQTKCSLTGASSTRKLQLPAMEWWLGCLTIGPALAFLKEQIEAGYVGEVLACHVSSMRDGAWSGPPAAPGSATPASAPTR